MVPKGYVICVRSLIKTELLSDVSQSSIAVAWFSDYSLANNNTYYKTWPKIARSCNRYVHGFVSD